MKLQKHHFTGKLAGCFIFFSLKETHKLILNATNTTLKWQLSTQKPSVRPYPPMHWFSILCLNLRDPHDVRGTVPASYISYLSSPCPLFWPRASLRITPRVSLHPHLGSCANSSQSQFLSVFHSKYHLENTTSSMKHPLTSRFLFFFFLLCMPLKFRIGITPIYHLTKHSFASTASTVPLPLQARAFQMEQWQRIHLPMQETEEMQVQSLGWEDPLEEEMATYSSILAWEIPWAEEPGSPWSCKGLDMTEHTHTANALFVCGGWRHSRYIWCFSIKCFMTYCFE